MSAFIFSSYSFDIQRGELCLHYDYHTHHFMEKITYPNAPFSINQEVVNKCCQLIHLAAGISYYKAVLAPQIEVKGYTLTKEEATFFKTFYQKGLGQFSAENGLDIVDIHFPFTNTAATPPFSLQLTDACFVPVGGGKDSCVTIEKMKRAGKNITLISVNSARPIDDCKHIAGLPQITIRREISENLLNNTDFYNGHVPITGILAFVMMLACVLYDKNCIMMSCEKSASEGNFVYHGQEINHQWSKSAEFEAIFAHLTNRILPAFRYTSALRDLTEFQIAEQFAATCAPYFDVFTSCNKAFRLDMGKRLDRWCGHCDKCRFVFLMLAPFMDKNKLISVVGCNPLNDTTQKAGYAELLGLTGHKPFECVGTANECRQALARLWKMPNWQDDVLVKAFKDEIK